jgi:hypothetical protein
MSPPFIIISCSCSRLLSWLHGSRLQNPSVCPLSWSRHNFFCKLIMLIEIMSIVSEMKQAERQTDRHDIRTIQFCYKFRAMNAKI